MDLDKIKPTSGRLVVTKPSPLTEGGIHKLDSEVLYTPSHSAEHRRQYGVKCKVLRIAPDVHECSVGDTIIIGEFAGTPIYDEDRELPYWLIGEGQIIAVLGS